MWWSFLLHTSDGTISLKESIVWFQHCTKLYTKFKVQSATPAQTHRTTLDTFARSSLTFDASSHTVRQGRFQPTIEDLSPAIPCLSPSAESMYTSVCRNTAEGASARGFSDTHHRQLFVIFCDERWIRPTYLGVQFLLELLTRPRSFLSGDQLIHVTFPANQLSL